MKFCLSPADQSKIRLAMSLRRVDPADMPPSARANAIASVNASSTAALKTTNLKRGAAQAGLSHTLRPATGSSPSIQLSSTQANGEEEVMEEETTDDLYCTMNTNVVGIQYYRGQYQYSIQDVSPHRILRVGLVGPGEEVLLVREPQNTHDR